MRHSRGRTSGTGHFCRLHRDVFPPNSSRGRDLAPSFAPSVVAAAALAVVAVIAGFGSVGQAQTGPNQVWIVTTAAAGSPGALSFNVPPSGSATTSNDQTGTAGPCTANIHLNAVATFDAAVNLRIDGTAVSATADCLPGSASIVATTTSAAPLDRPFPNATKTTSAGTLIVTVTAGGNVVTTDSATFTATCQSGCGQPEPAVVSAVTGSVQVTAQGAPVTLGPGSALGKGAELTTGGDGQVQGGCSNGSTFAIGPNSSVFLDDSLCQQSGSGMVDVTQGQLMIANKSGTTRTRVNAAPFSVGVQTPVSRTVDASADASFSTTYDQVGNLGTATTSVTAGSVSVADSATGEVQTAMLGNLVTVTGPVPAVVAALLPGSRSVQVGVPATVFATMINAGDRPAIACKITKVTQVAADLRYQVTDAATNQIVGDHDTPTGIAARGNRTFVIALTPSQPFAPTDLELGFACGGTRAPTVVGLDTLLLSASATPVPDIVALAAAEGGTVVIPGVGGTGAFAVATVNVGAAAQIVAAADTGAASLPLQLRICQTRPETGVCLGAVDSSVAVQIAAGATPTFTIFATASGPVAFDPAANRIFVRFRDSGGVVHGATSVAVRTN